LGLECYGFATLARVRLRLSAGARDTRHPIRKEALVPEPSAIEGVLSALVEAMEAREAAEPDLPEWEATARLRAAEASLLRLYRESGRNQPHRIGIEIEVSHANVGPTMVEVA
jgi:hypothetical protein